MIILKSFQNYHMMQLFTNTKQIISTRYDQGHSEDVIFMITYYAHIYRNQNTKAPMPSIFNDHLEYLIITAYKSQGRFMNFSLVEQRITSKTFFYEIY